MVFPVTFISNFYSHQSSSSAVIPSEISLLFASTAQNHFDHRPAGAEEKAKARISHQHQPQKTSHKSSLLWLTKIMEGSRWAFWIIFIFSSKFHSFKFFLKFCQCCCSGSLSVDQHHHRHRRESDNLVIWSFSLFLLAKHFPSPSPSRAPSTSLSISWNNSFSSGLRQGKRGSSEPLEKNNKRSRLKREETKNEEIFYSSHESSRRISAQQLFLCVYNKDVSSSSQSCECE